MSLPSPLHQRLSAAKLDHPPGEFFRPTFSMEKPSLKRTFLAPENRGPWGKRRFRTWKPSIFRGELLFSGRVSKNMASRTEDEWPVSIKTMFPRNHEYGTKGISFFPGVFSPWIRIQPGPGGAVKIEAWLLNLLVFAAENQWWRKMIQLLLGQSWPIFRGELLASGGVIIIIGGGSSWASA